MGIGKAFNSTINWLTEDDQTKLGEEKQKGKDGATAPAHPQKVKQPSVNTYTGAYSHRVKPAAISVDSTWSTDDAEGALAPKNDGDDGNLPYSLFNRYALYNYRGFYGGFSQNISNYYSDIDNNSNVFRGNQFYGEKKLRDLDVRDITEKDVIQFYSENFPMIAYSPTDFLYNKYFQDIPVNHLITLRRFAMPCEDNIFYSKDNKDFPKHVSTCTATTYFGEKTENKLEEILKFSGVGLKWKELQAHMQEISAGSSTSKEGKFDAPFGKPTALSLLGSHMAGRSAASLYRTKNLGGGDPLQRYEAYVKGPVNVVDNTTIRDRGLQFKNEFELKFDYELRSWYMVNPKIAMLDIFANMLVMTTNNGDFWGGGWRYNGGQSPSMITDMFGDKKLLRQGDFIGYAQSVVTDVLHGNKSKGIKGLKNMFGDGSGAFSFKSLLETGKQLLQNLLTQKIGALMDNFSGGQQNASAETPKALVSGDPTGYWHVVIGNPMNPIAIMGDMICKDENTFTLGGGLGYDDFPMEFSVNIKLNHSKPRDRSDIENMFNAGHGRIYAAPASDDVLNIAGKEVQEYGVLAVGAGMHSGVDKVAEKLDLGKEHVANIIAMDIL